MDKVRFLMSDTGAQITEACREALEQKGVEVTVVEKDGNKVLQIRLYGQQRMNLLRKLKMECYMLEKRERRK